MKPDPSLENELEIVVKVQIWCFMSTIMRTSREILHKYGVCVCEEGVPIDSWMTGIKGSTWEWALGSRQGAALKATGTGLIPYSPAPPLGLLRFLGDPELCVFASQFPSHFMACSYYVQYFFFLSSSLRRQSKLKCFLNRWSEPQTSLVCNRVKAEPSPNSRNQKSKEKLVECVFFPLMLCVSPTVPNDPKCSMELKRTHTHTPTHVRTWGRQCPVKLRPLTREQKKTLNSEFLVGNSLYIVYCRFSLIDFTQVCLSINK